MSHEMIRAAGAVLWRDPGGGTEVALVHRPKYDDWSLPKGKLDPGETPAQAAVREVREETGWSGDLGRPLGEIRYWQERQGEVREKVVDYWLMQATSGTFVPSDEVDELRWLAPGEAQSLLSYDRDREVLERAFPPA